MKEAANGGPGEAASQGLDLLATVGRLLDAVTDDYDGGAVEAVAGACVPTFCDLCAVELIGADHRVHPVASRAAAGSGLHRPERWADVVADLSGVDRPVLASVGDAGEIPHLRALRERLGAGSLLVAPITAGGALLGWLVAATAPPRGFVGADLEVGAQLGRVLGATIQRVGLNRRLQALAQEQGRVAHDFNNLLTLILGYSQLLGRAISDPSLRSLAVEIEGAAHRAAGLTQEMLELGARESSSVAPDPARDWPAGGAAAGGAEGGAAAGGAAPDGAAAGPNNAEVAAGDGASFGPSAVQDAPGEGWPPGRTLAGRVLYVEDEPALRHAGQESLATVGLDVVAAESAEIALSILAGDPTFDALVTDIALPGLTGVQLARAVRPTHPGLKVLYVTGYSGDPDRDHTPAPGEPVLRKPYRPDALRLRVAELLDRSD